jgi:hypothetical protein
MYVGRFNTLPRFVSGVSNKHQCYYIGVLYIGSLMWVYVLAT